MRRCGLKRNLSERVENERIENSEKDIEWMWGVTGRETD